MLCFFAAATSVFQLGFDIASCPSRVPIFTGYRRGCGDVALMRSTQMPAVLTDAEAEGAGPAQEYCWRAGLSDGLQRMVSRVPVAAFFHHDRSDQ